MAASVTCSATDAARSRSRRDRAWVPITINCGTALDISGINLLYGTPGFVFNQQFTVEAVAHADTLGQYSDPEGRGGAYSLGMLSTAQDDKLSLTFDAQGRSWSVALHTEEERFTTDPRAVTVTGGGVRVRFQRPGAAVLRLSRAGS